MKILFTSILIIFGLCNLYSQQKFCADSSIRIKYTTPGDPFVLYLNPDTSGNNIFNGTYGNNTNPEKGIIAIKTNWGDSIYWAKRYSSDNNVYLATSSSTTAPNGTLILTGKRKFSNTISFLVSRIDTNGNVLWMRHLPHKSGVSNYNFTDRNIFVSDDAIYFTVRLGQYDFVGKMDLNGNLLWSKGFLLRTNLYDNYITNGLFEKDGVVYFASNRVQFNSITGNIIYAGFVISKLNDADGSFIDGNTYSIVQDNYAKGLQVGYLRPYPDGSFSLVGIVWVDGNNLGLQPQVHTRLNIRINPNLSPLAGHYYNSNKSSDQHFQFDMNNQKQSIFVNSPGENSTKYFLSYDSNQNLLRSRKFVVPTNPNTGDYRINLDEKQNIHFLYPYYTATNQFILEYARISDFAAANTLNCFGVDTASIFEQYPLILTKEPFVWDFYYHDQLNCLPVNIITEDAVINKEVICKQVSYCDSVKIKGDTSVCLAGLPVRYTVYQNPECLKGISWQTDTTIAKIIRYEADSAVTIQFKKTGQFYLNAFVNNCVVADSMLVKVSTPAPAGSLQLNRDSLLCPGATLILSVNPRYKTYQWQDGSTQNTYTVSSPGLYRITATDSCGNMTKDSINVSLVDTSFHIPSSYSFCDYDTARVLLPTGITSINWQPSVAGVLSGNRLLFYPQQTTSYSITAQRPPGCAMQTTITAIKETCPEWIRFPSGFTPDANGVNDIYKPGVSGQLTTYDLKIFNRYGQLIFSSNNPYSGWDGRLKGAAQPNGVYVFISRHKFAGGTEQISKGTIMLIR